MDIEPLLDAFLPGARFNSGQFRTRNKEHTFRQTCHTSFESHQFSSIGIPESPDDRCLFSSKWFSNWTRNGGLIFFILILGRWHHCVFFEAGISGFEGDEWEIKGCPFTTWRGKFKKWISRLMSCGPVCLEINSGEKARTIDGEEWACFGIPGNVSRSPTEI